MRASLTILAALLATACRPPVALPPAHLNDTVIQDELFAADRAYARAVADSGAPAWNARFAPDIVKPGDGGLVLLRGVTPVAANDKAIFSDPSRILRWEPTDAAGYADGRTGITVGRSAWVRRSTGTDTISTGRYLTLWRKQPDGSWKILMDTGWSDK
jgi:ketosteroid isomerase-like protein